MVKQVSTVCPRDCYDTCALIATVGESGRILSIDGDPRNPVTGRLTCPRGAKDHERLHQHRVRAPHLRRRGRLVQTDWEDALTVLSQKLARTLETHGPEAVLHLDYAGNMGLLTGAFPQRLWNCLGASYTDWALCSSSGHQGLALHYGDSHGIRPIEPLSADLIVFWGFNPAASSSHLWSLARKARRQRGARIVVIDPRKSQSANRADLWIHPRPGSDVALAYGLIDALVRHGSTDPHFIQEWTLGFDQLRAAAAKWTLARVERTTGVAGSDVERLAEAYGNAKSSVTMIGIGLQKCDQGADQVRAVSFIPALLGFHRGFFYAGGDSFSIDYALISGRALANKASKVVKQVALADLVQAGDFNFVHVSCTNPAMTLPNQHAFREGLSREDLFCVVHDTHWTETARYADLILPAPTYLEKDDLVIPWGHNYLQLSHRVVPPITDSRSEIWVMRETARRLGLAEEWLYEDPWPVIELALADALEGGSFESLRSGEMLALETKPASSYPTPSGKIEFYSSQALERGWSPLPVQNPLHIEGASLILLTSATPHYTSTQFQEVYGPIPAEVMINPQDAGRRGIQGGQEVLLVNDRGRVHVKVTISDAVPVGVLWSPRQSEGLAGEPQNCLTSSRPQEIGGGPRFNSTTVTLCPL